MTRVYVHRDWVEQDFYRVEEGTDEYCYKVPSELLKQYDEKMKKVNIACSDFNKVAEQVYQEYLKAERLHKLIQSAKDNPSRNFKAAVISEFGWTKVDVSTWTDGQRTLKLHEAFNEVISKLENEK